MKLEKIIPITGNLIVKTGLHIGAGDTDMHIGGTDNPVIKHPHTLEPYIPGSSLKGKVRSLLELYYGLIQYGDANGLTSLTKLTNACKDQNLKDNGFTLLKIFGCSGSEESNLGPTRTAFSDAFLTDECRKFLKNNNLSATEIKAENVIDRKQATAKHPRHTERVVAGCTFEFEISLKIFSDDNEGKLLEMLLTGLKLLSLDALGGSGSRGYGRIELKFEDQNISERFNKISLR